MPGQRLLSPWAHALHGWGRGDLAKPTQQELGTGAWITGQGNKLEFSLSPEQKQSPRPQTPTRTDTGNTATKHREHEHKTRRKRNGVRRWLWLPVLPEHTQLLPGGILIYLQKELHGRGKKVAAAALQSIKYLVQRQFISSQG